MEHEENHQDDEIKEDLFENEHENDVLKVEEDEDDEELKKSRFLYCLDFPKATWLIFMTEFGERFCFYGFKTILSLYFVKFLLFSEDGATSAIHAFIFASYLTPLLGGYIADVYLGKYWTIVILSLVYCLGQSIIAITAIQGVTGTPPHWWGVALGLCLVALGTGGIKPNVSSMGGDQFSEKNTRLLSSYFAIFYLMINTGGMTSAFITPLLTQVAGWAWAFAIPAIVLFIASFIFAIGYKGYKHVAPKRDNIVNQFVKVVFYGITQLRSDVRVEHWLDRSKSRYDHQLVEDCKVAIRVAKCLSPLFVFWALYDQYATRWVYQAEKMNRYIGSYQIDSGQVTVLNSIFILTCVPIFDYVVYPLFEKCFKFTLLKRMIVGFIVASISFIMAAIVEFFVVLYPARVHVAWQIPQYLVLTWAEIMVSITGLEFSYSQAPKSMKSIMSSYFLMTTAAGNLLVAVIADLPLPKDLPFKQGYEFIFYAVLIIFFMFVFMFIVRDYKYREDVENVVQEPTVALLEQETFPDDSASHLNNEEIATDDPVI